ncbi:mechanosensitive ion channel family protein [Leptolyngbyaceae cyanobacterium UHCC 1019]
MNIVITVVQVAIVIFAFTLLNWLLGKSLKTLAASQKEKTAQRLVSLRQNLSLLCLLAGIGLTLLIVSVNGVLIYQGKDVLDFQIRLLQSIPAEFWITLATAIAQCVMLLLLVKFSLPLLHHLLDLATTYAKNYDRITANDESVEAFFHTLKKILTTSTWIAAGILCTQFLNLPAAIPKYLFIGLKAYGAIAIGRLLIKAISVVVDTLDALSLQYSNADNLLRHYDRFRHLVPVLKKCLEYVLYVGIATLVIQDIDFIAWVADYADEIIAIIGIYFVTGLGIEIANVVLEDLVLRTDHLTDLQRQRRLTIIPLFKSFLKYAIYFTAALAMLKLINLDPTPLLAGAGIVGIVIGFGAQNLINDIVCGFFVLFENYYLVGDYIEAGKIEERLVEGIVEAIELRTTHIRHPDGQLQIIRNGEIGSIINYSKQYIYATVKVPVPHTANLDQAYEVIETVGHQLKADYLEVLEPTQIDGLEDLGEKTLLLRTLTKVKPGKHLYIQRLLRKRLKHAFDQERVSTESASSGRVF